ncbi:MAG: hypothetical protein H6618_02680 [Deltaproteobacteria bacterium]|nr:hypothetical protein [Deltaproteobacteria bacterium]
MIFTLASLRLAVPILSLNELLPIVLPAARQTASLVEHARMVLAVLIKSMASQNSEAAQKISEKLGVEGIVGIDGPLVSLWHGLQDFF